MSVNLNLLSNGGVKILSAPIQLTQIDINNKMIYQVYLFGEYVLNQIWNIQVKQGAERLDYLQFSPPIYR